LQPPPLGGERIDYKEMLMSDRYLITSESVCKGHPDKVADQISDAILDALIAQDPHCHVACETLVTTGLVLVAGEITTANAYVDIPKVVRETVRGIGYTNPHDGFDWETCAVLTSIDEQSPDIARGVDQGDPLAQGAGDQGIMFGYATSETEEYMPLPLVLANRISQRLAEVRDSGRMSYLGPDGKCQVTVEYEGDKALRVHTVVCSAQHSDTVEIDTVRRDLEAHVVRPCLPRELLPEEPTLHLNRTGRFVRGGPAADTGLTGRKIIADSYGGLARHGGGAFSGKDPSKVDRSATYAARWVAKNVVAAGLANRCEVQLAYCIGHAEPVSIHCETFGTGKISNEKLTSGIRRNFDLRPGAIIRDLRLLRPIYLKTAAYGHFGRNDPDFTWEALDRVEALRSLL
jgi:S-adenosylmethionine synthetase